jgi:hypothetical protein
MRFSGPQGHMVTRLKTRFGLVKEHRRQDRRRYRKSVRVDRQYLSSMSRDDSNGKFDQYDRL